MNNNLELIAKTLLEMSKKAGADLAETLIFEQESISVDTQNGSIETLERSEGIEVGLRVSVNNRQACISSSDVRKQTIEKMVERSVAMAREAPRDNDILSAKPDQIAKDWDLNSLDLIDEKAISNPERLKNWAIEAEDNAQSVEGVTQVQSSSASTGILKSYLATSNGFEGGYVRSRTNISCVSIAGNGQDMERDYAYEGRVHASDLPSASSIGLLSGQRVIERIG